MGNTSNFFLQHYKKTALHNNQFIPFGTQIIEVTKTIHLQASNIIHPSYSQQQNVQIISLYKAQKVPQYKTQGNPIVHAINNTNWQFGKSIQDIKYDLQNVFSTIPALKKHYNTLIILPDASILHTHFLHPVQQVIPHQLCVNNYLHPITLWDVYENYILWKQLLQDFKGDFPSVKQKINLYFTQMEKQQMYYFSFRGIKDPKLWKYFGKSDCASYEKSLILAPQINQQDIVLLDNSIHKQNKISAACWEMLHTFAPNSITVIKLFE